MTILIVTYAVIWLTGIGSTYVTTDILKRQNEIILRQKEAGYR